MVGDKPAFSIHLCLGESRAPLRHIPAFLFAYSTPGGSPALPAECLAATREATLAFLLDELRTHERIVTDGVAAAYAPHELADKLTNQQLDIREAALDGRVFQAALQDELLGRQMWSAHDYLDRIRAAIFEELGTGAATIHPVRRALQRHLVKQLKAAKATNPTLEAHFADLVRLAAAAGVN